MYLNESEARRLNESACHVRKMPKAMKVSPPLLARQSKAYCGPHARLVVIMADCETHCLSLHHSMCQTGILRPGVVSGVTSTCVGKDNTRCVIRLRGIRFVLHTVAMLLTSLPYCRTGLGQRSDRTGVVDCRPAHNIVRRGNVPKRAVQRSRACGDSERGTWCQAVQ